MYQRILVPVDGSETSNRGLDEAISLARVTGGRIRLLHVVDVMPCGYVMETCSDCHVDRLAALSEEGRKLLETAQTRAADACVPAEAVLHEDLQRRFIECVSEEIKSWNADLVVIGTHGRQGVRRLLLGSDADRIVRSAQVPVLLVRLARVVPAATVVDESRTVHVHLPSAALSIER